MLVFLIAGGFLSGHTPAQVMGAFDTTDGLPLRGTLIHLAVSCVYGTLFALLTRGLAGLLRSSAMVSLLGLFYGFLLWLIAVTLLRQAAASLLAVAPALVFLLAHLAYGLALGLAISRQVASLSPESRGITGQNNVR